MSDIAEALRQFPWRTDSQQHLAMRAAAHISQLEADFAEASKERSHQHGRADRNAREYANAQKTCEELRARIEKLEAALRDSRAEVLEEAARCADRNAAEAWQEGAEETRGLMRLQAADIAAAIRALKDQAIT